MKLIFLFMLPLALAMEPEPEPEAEPAAGEPTYPFCASHISASINSTAR
eukprot:SAG11_NODE_35611_length_265_cov_7.566265_1_plen_48_part_10